MESDKACVYCANPLPHGAKVCAACSRSQNKTVNRAIFFGSVVAVATFTLSSLAYIADKGSFYWNRMSTGDRLTLPAFMLYDSATVYNNGYRSLNILFAEVRIPRFGVVETMDIYRNAPPGGLVRFQAGPHVRHQMLIDIDSNAILLAENGETVLPIAASKSDPHYRTRLNLLKKLKKSLRVFECEIIISFIGSTDENTQSQAFDCSAFLAKRL